MEAFTAVVRIGQRGLKTETLCRWSDSDPLEPHYIKTAGDIQQTRWRKLHGFQGDDDFGYNWYQAWISRQLRLPQLIHGEGLGDIVARWSEHPLADHDEAATLIFPPTLLHVFLSLHVRLCRALAAQEALRSDQARSSTGSYDVLTAIRSERAHAKREKRHRHHPLLRASLMNFTVTPGFTFMWTFPLDAH